MEKNEIIVRSATNEFYSVIGAHEIGNLPIGHFLGDYGVPYIDEDAKWKTRKLRQIPRWARYFLFKSLRRTFCTY